ncbi:hypothetical protein F7734_42805 [Scytonema sp. UIC 10036]|uniref:hypothetical protein n=1 Tax=Scytonema sp. UIC 10036 TaxID=2304196 RepID=UPI0012DA5A3C|nr:hypothetical protein [Scytonema sp. UIC 10036]MUG98666.1 hypothetical protein [Scytonema sp. UIC 10036]
MSFSKSYKKAAVEKPLHLVEMVKVARSLESGVLYFFNRFLKPHKALSITND